jgi:hypothetical protein
VLDLRHDAADGPGPRRFASAVLALPESSWMLWPERVLIYSLVYGLRPRRCLEVGTFQGGSAVLIVAALDDIGDGRLVCVDPHPKVPEEVWAGLAHRAAMVAGPSPAALAEAAGVAGGGFDFALIDGAHGYAEVVADFEGALPVLADDAYLAFHDANFSEVRDGIDHVLARYPGELTDVGLLSTMRIAEPDRPDRVWGGVRVVRFRRGQGAAG